MFNGRNGDVEPFALHLCRTRQDGVFRNNDVSRLHGFQQPELHALTVNQGLVLVDAGGYRVPAHSVARAYRRVEAVVPWLAVRPDEVRIAHGLAQSRNGRFPDSLHRHRIRLAVNVTRYRDMCHLPVLPAASVLGGKFVGLLQQGKLVVRSGRGGLLPLQAFGQFRHLPFQFRS